jgi:hypothetical protein
MLPFNERLYRLVAAIRYSSPDIIDGEHVEKILEVIESRERKAFEVGHRRSSGDGHCYSDFEEYFASPEYLSEEIAKDE